MAYAKLSNRLSELRKRVAYIAQDDPTTLALLLEKDDINILVNTIATLGLMKSRETVGLLQPLIGHPNALVRTEIIIVLVELDDAARIALYLNDCDEKVRIKALQSLAKLKYTVIYYDILRRIKSKFFKELDFSEQREYFNCLVANGGHEVITELQKMLFKWVLFGRKSYSIMRKLSAMALADIGTEHVLNILKRGAKKRNKDVNNACQMALRKT
jgi:HEAT repeat protein